jgi:hypothetical protein
MTRISGTELTDVKVRRIAIVDKAAIRQPFKIMKREQKPDALATHTQKAETANMSTLNKLFGSLFKSATAVKAPAPKMTAVIVNKSADQSKAILRMKAAGFEHEDGVENETSVVYTRKGETPADPADDNFIVLKSDEDTAVMIADVRKSLLGPDNDMSTSFASRVAQDCVLPGIANAFDTLSSTMWSGLLDAADPSEAAAGIDAAFADAAMYIKTLIGTIPVEAFKMDVVKSEGGVLTMLWSPAGGVIRFPMVSDKESPTSRAQNMGPNGGSMGVDTTDGTDIDGDGGEMDKILKIRKTPEGVEPTYAATKADMPVLKAAKKPAKDTVDVVDAADPTDMADEAEGGGKKKTKDMKKGDEPAGVTKSDLEAITKLLGDKVEAGFTALKKQMTSMSDDVDDLQQRVAKSEQDTKRVTATLRSTVLKTEPDTDRRAPLSENEIGDSDIVLIDTAYNRVA